MSDPTPSPGGTRDAKLAGVIGWPVRQSVSPVLHAHWLRQHDLTGAYVVLPARPEDFGKVVAALPLMGFVGANVTVPHKEAAFALSATLDDDAKATGAVNMLVFRDGLVHGHNTDVGGFAAHLVHSIGANAVRRGPAVVLGAGGAARSVLLALIRQGVTEIGLLNRTRARADVLAAYFGGKQEYSAARITALDWADRDLALSGANLLVNTTALGMTGKDRLDLPLAALPKSAAVADIVYNPLQTDLLVRARARGNTVIDGLGMLMHQAVPAFAAWFGVRPEVTAALRSELEGALSGTERPGFTASPAHKRPEMPTRKLANGALRRRPLVVGLTGSIGMGKSETAKMFARLGIATYDSDQVVHELYDENGEAVSAVADAFPGAVQANRADREALSKIVTADKTAFGRLEAIVHPLVRARREAFLAKAKGEGRDIVVLDIPLLFESGSGPDVDAIVVVSAPEDVRRKRVLARPGMTPEKFEAIASRQLPDEEKRAKADYIIETGEGLDHAFEMVKDVVANLRKRAAP